MLTDLGLWPYPYRHQQLFVKVEKLSAWCLGTDVIDTIIHAWTLEKAIGVIHNELTFLWVASYGEERPLPELQAKFSHAGQASHKKAILDYIARNQAHCETAARLENNDAIWFMDELQEVRPMSSLPYFRFIVRRR